MPLNKIEEIIEDVRLGKMVVLIDDEDRENEGDIVMAADCVTAEHINFMARYARGLICMPLSRAHCERLGLRLMVENNGSGFGTKFTTSIEAASGVTTGISAADRAHTIRIAADRNALPEHLVQPGHVFPLVAEPGGVLVRAGHTEAACDLARLAGLGEAGVICEVMNDDGSMARRPDLEAFASKHGLKIGTIADLIHYRVVNESTVEKLSADRVQTDHGLFTLHTCRDRISGQIHLALVCGELGPDKPVLVRVQRAATVRDLLGIQTEAPDTSGWNIQRCLNRIAEEKLGVIVLLGGRESPAGLLHSVEVAAGRKRLVPPSCVGGHQNIHTVGVGSQILRMLGLRKLRLMNSQAKYSAISGFDLQVIEYVAP